LIEKKHYSAPVLDDYNNLIGSVDLADIVFKFIERITDKSVFFRNDYRDLMKNDSHFKKISVKEVINEKKKPKNTN